MSRKSRRARAKANAKPARAQPAPLKAEQPTSEPAPPRRSARLAPWVAAVAVVGILGVAGAMYALIPRGDQASTQVRGSTTVASTTTNTAATKTTPASSVSSSDWKSVSDITPADAKLGTLERHPVAGGFKPNNVKLEGCNTSDWTCVEQAYGNLVYYDGPKVALAKFDAAIANPGPTEQNCHRIAHAMGSAALERYKGRVGKAFSEGSSSCWSGYYHGILEHAFQTEKLTQFTSDELARISRKFCDDPDVRATSWIAYQCVHGLGHGLMITTALDLPLALESCNKLNGEWDQQSCKGGVFMENINTSYGATSEYIKKDDLLYPCNMVKEGDKLYCYLMQTSYILRQNGWNWDATAELCTRSDKGWVATCFQSYGRDASGSTRQNATEILRLCGQAGRYGGELDCVLGAAKDVTANYNDGKPAAKLCDQARDDLRRNCYWAVGTISGGFKASADDRLLDCQSYTSDGAMVEACRLGANGYPM